MRFPLLARPRTSSTQFLRPGRGRREPRAVAGYREGRVRRRFTNMLGRSICARGRSARSLGYSRRGCSWRFTRNCRLYGPDYPVLYIGTGFPPSPVVRGSARQSSALLCADTGERPAAPRKRGQVRRRGVRRLRLRRKQCGLFPAELPPVWRNFDYYRGMG